MSRQRCLGGGGEVRSVHAAAGAVPEHEPGTWIVDAAQVDACRAVRCLDVQHAPESARAAMSSALRPGRTFEIATKGLLR